MAHGTIAGVQYLRGIAALMVVLHHAQTPFGVTWFEGGASGVDIFFVISGFIMALTTAKFDPAGDRLAQAAEFLKRRFLRVVPLYWLFLCVAALMWGALDEQGLWKDLLFIPRQHPTATGEIWPRLIPGWTINYEVFFYVVFAAAMLAGRLRMLAVGAALLACVAAGALTTWNAAPGRFWTNSIVIEFLFGIAAYHGLQRWTVPAPWVVLVLGVGLLMLPTGLPRFLDSGIPALLIVVAAVQLAQGTDWRRLHALGDASYSLYLVHLFAFWPAFGVAKRLGLTAGAAWQSALGIAVLTVVAVVAGMLVHSHVEKRLTRAIHALLERRVRVHASAGSSAAAND